MSTDKESKSGRRKYFIRASAITIMVVLALVVLFAKKIFIMVGPGKSAVFFDLIEGTDTKDVYGEGLKIIAPWNKLYIYDVRERILEKEITVVSKDGLSIKVELAIRLRPERDSLGWIHQHLGPNYDSVVVMPEVESSIRHIISSHEPHELYSFKGDFIESSERAQCIKEFGEKNIIVDDIFIKRVTLPATVASAIEKKLEHQQRFLQYQYILKQEEMEKNRKIIEAQGIDSFQRVSKISYLKMKGVEATVDIAKSQNSKVVVIGGSENQLPVILNAEK
ncbi:MAG: prohibitin family protein [Flavobacteriales bacterium]